VPHSKARRREKGFGKQLYLAVTVMFLRGFFAHAFLGFKLKAAFLARPKS
jgi:hypothetical protein